MKIQDVLSQVTRLYVETAPFIYYTENRVGYVDKMRDVFAEVYKGQIQAITSAITLTETLMKPLEKGDTALVNQYRTLFYQTQGIRVLAISPRIAENAANLRARYGLKTPDALHVAAAIDSGSDAFLTNGLGIKRVSEITVLILDELEL